MSTGFPATPDASVATPTYEVYTRVSDDGVRKLGSFTHLPEANHLARNALDEWPRDAFAKWEESVDADGKVRIDAEFQMNDRAEVWVQFSDEGRRGEVWVVLREEGGILRSVHQTEAGAGRAREAGEEVRRWDLMA